MSKSDRTIQEHLTDSAVNDQGKSYPAPQWSPGNAPRSEDASFSFEPETSGEANRPRAMVGYKELAEKLTAMGIPETSENIANKIARGGFTAVFLIQCLKAIGADTLRLD